MARERFISRVGVGGASKAEYERFLAWFEKNRAETVKEMLDQGKPLKEVASILGLSHQALHKSYYKAVCKRTG